MSETGMPSAVAKSADTEAGKMALGELEEMGT
jgi:hypothetical protein